MEGLDPAAAFAHEGEDRTAVLGPTIDFGARRVRQADGLRRGAAGESGEGQDEEQFQWGGGEGDHTLRRLEVGIPDPFALLALEAGDLDTSPDLDP